MGVRRGENGKQLSGAAGAVHLVGLDNKVGFGHGVGHRLIEEVQFVSLAIAEQKQFLARPGYQVIPITAPRNVNLPLHLVKGGQPLAQLLRRRIGVVGENRDTGQHPRKPDGVVTFGATNIDYPGVTLAAQRN